MGVRLKYSSNGGFMVHHNSELSLVVEVKSKQYLDKSLMELKKSILRKLNEAISLRGDGFFMNKGRLCVFKVDGLKNQIYSIHSGSTKMYHDLKEVFWWKGFKNDIAEFVAKCPKCQKVKVEL